MSPWKQKMNHIDTVMQAVHHELKRGERGERKGNAGLVF
jgi:hypothetical protein